MRKILVATIKSGVGKTIVPSSLTCSLKRLTKEWFKARGILILVPEEAGSKYG